MLRRVTCTRVSGTAAAAARASTLVAPRCVTGTPRHSPRHGLPISCLSTAHRCFSSRSGDEVAKKDTAGAAAKAASATTAAQVLAANGAAKAAAAGSEERSFSSSSSGNNSSHNSAQADQHMEAKEQQQQQEGEEAGSRAAPSSTSGIRSIGIKLSEDDELVRAFNSFSKTVNGCSQEEFLVGVKQAYAGLAVLLNSFVEKAQQPLTGPTEEAKVALAGREACKMLIQEYNSDADATKAAAAAKTEEATSDATAAAAAAVSSGNTNSAGGSGGGAAAKTAATSGGTMMAHSTVEWVEQTVASAIMSCLPISRHLAAAIFKIWVLQREKKANLSTIASPADYLLDSKLVVFARLDKPRIYFNSNNICAELDVTMNNDYLRKLDPSTSGAAATTPEQQKKQKAGKDDDDVDEGMFEVLTDTTANATRATPEEHTFVLDKKTKKMTHTSPTAARQSPVATAAAAAAPEAASGDGAASPASGKSACGSRLQVTCVKMSGDHASVSPAAASEHQAQTATTASTTSSNNNNGVHASERSAEKPVAAAAATPQDDAETCSVFIKVNGNALPPIPGDARACALLTVDVVVPPERYAYNFEWFYKRIVGYENEYERIAAARVFASNSPKSIGAFLDFVMRMVSGKSVEFMFSKSIGRMIGIPEDVSETPPASRKLVCMYMDASKRWVLSDLVTLAPVIESKLPKD